MGGLLTVIVSYDVLECVVILLLELIGRLVDHIRISACGGGHMCTGINYKNYLFCR